MIEPKLLGSVQNAFECVGGRQWWSRGFELARHSEIFKRGTQTFVGYISVALRLRVVFSDIQLSNTDFGYTCRISKESSPPAAAKRRASQVGARIEIAIDHDLELYYVVTRGELGGGTSVGRVGT